MVQLLKISGALLICFMLSGCEKMFLEQPKNNPEAIFENLWVTFEEEYAPFDERKVNWLEAYATFRPLINENSSDDHLFNVLCEMLSVFDDGHVSLTAPSKNIYYSNKIMREKIDHDLFNKTIIKENYLKDGYKSGPEESYIYGGIKDHNIGYIFFDHVGENFFKLNDFVDEFESADGFIIDMRHNQGGDFTYCFSEIGRFTNQKRPVFRSKTKNGKEKDDYTPWKEWDIVPSGNYIDKPMVILTDRYTISAGERSVMAFKTLPQAIIMGDTTNGAHSTMIGRELANGWFYVLVPQKVELNDGKSYEGIGLAPDVYVKNRLSEVTSGIDHVLQSAINHITDGR